MENVNVSEIYLGYRCPSQCLVAKLTRSPSEVFHKRLTLCPTDPRFLYSTRESLIKLEFRKGESSKTHLFSTDGGILSFDVDWNTDWLYWANVTGHIQRTSLTQVKTEVVPTPVPGNRFDSRFASDILFTIEATRLNVKTRR